MSMAEVIYLDKKREKLSPHMTGKAKCIQCKHEWVGVAPQGTIWLECPSCTLQKGAFIYACEPDNMKSIFTCNCGNEIFLIADNGTICTLCGTWQSFQ